LYSGLRPDNRQRGAGGSGSQGPHLGEPFFEKSLLGFIADKLKSLLVAFCGAGVRSTPAQQIGSCGVQQAVVVEIARRGQSVDL